MHRSVILIIFALYMTRRKQFKTESTGFLVAKENFVKIMDACINVQSDEPQLSTEYSFLQTFNSKGDAYLVVAIINI